MKFRIVNMNVARCSLPDEGKRFTGNSELITDYALSLVSNSFNKQDECAVVALQESVLPVSGSDMMNALRERSALGFVCESALRFSLSNLLAVSQIAFDHGVFVSSDFGDNPKKPKLNPWVVVGDVLIINHHGKASSGSVRINQAAELRDFINNSVYEKIIILGDFNVSKDSDEFNQWLDNGFVNCGAGSVDNTYIKNGGSIIDHILIKGELAFSDFKVNDDEGLSDHLAISCIVEG